MRRLLRWTLRAAQALAVVALVAAATLLWWMDASLPELDVICRYLYIEACPRSLSSGWEALAKTSEPFPLTHGG